VEGVDEEAVAGVFDDSVDFVVSAGFVLSVDFELSELVPSLGLDRESVR
jgi:hypothetical protein